MKNEEDEAFDELAKRQGSWGGGFTAKRQMAADKLQDGNVDGCIACDARAQPAQEPVAWKLMPRDATDSMLKAMDECSTEGYDERLYAGHAASVYMAAWDEAPETIPKRKWVGLTEEEHTQIAIDAGCMSADWVFYGALIERKLREKNT